VSNIYWCKVCFDVEELPNGGTPEHECTDPKCACRALGCVKKFEK
jgi:hypothetical protein